MIDFGSSVYQLKEQLQEYGLRQLACDLDDTIARTSDAFYALLSARFPPPASLTEDILRKHYALTGKILYWGDIPEANNHAYAVVDDPEFHAAFEPLEGAVQGVQKLHRRNLLGCYLTMRLETMRDGTEQWLAGHDFPALPVAMRTVHFTQAIEWKAAALEFLFPEVSGIIDNDARIARLLEDRGYRGKVYLVGLHEHEYRPSNTVTPIERWPELVNALLSSLDTPEQ